MLARVRGIYTTGVTKLLLEDGFSITHPTKTIKERFEIEDNFNEPDVSIYDREDRQGIILIGREKAVNKVLNIFQDVLPDVIIRRSIVNLGAIYKGVVKAVEGNYTTIDLGSCHGKIATHSNLRIGEGFLVQVIRPCWLKIVRLSEKIRVEGKNSFLFLQGDVRVSPKIRSLEKRETLLTLGRLVERDGWGIFWKESACGQEISTLMQEVKTLERVAETLLREAEKAPAPSLVFEGSAIAESEFPSLSKQRFDEIRNTVVCTIPGHHYYKSASDDYAFVVEFAEELLKGGANAIILANALHKVAKKHGPRIGDSMRIEHVKLNGQTLLLTPGQIIETLRDGDFVLRRNFCSNGIFDGLNVRREIGDYALTEVCEGSWFLKSTYYSKNNQLKGEYHNVNTPIEIYQNHIRYVDLSVDVIRKPSGHVEVIELEELYKACEEGVISRKLLEKTEEKVEELKEHLISN